MTDEQQQAVLAFAHEAKHFEERVTAGVALEPDELYTLLIALQQAALALPDLEPDLSSPAVEFDGTDTDRRNEVSPAVPDLGFYHHVLNPNEVLEAPAVALGDAVDDLADILYELRTGQALLLEVSMEEAAWAWRWAFRNHWRAHAVGLTTALDAQLR